MHPTAAHPDPEDLRIDVDVQRALEVLSGNVFAGQKACLRELVANAADSISQLPRESLGNVEIRLLPRRSEGRLTVSDHGVGMTREEASRRLGTLFSSSKAPRGGTIGQFGIGFYSCFPLCTRVEVLTRSRQPEDSGTRVLYEGGTSLRLEPVAVEHPGTTIVLHLKPDHRSLVEEDVLRKLITQDCDFIPYPIYLGTGFTVLNRLDAPWYHPEAAEPELRKGLEAILEVSEPLAIVPLHADGGFGEVHGALYVGPRRMKPALRLYSHRVLITADGGELLPESLRPWLSGVLDAENLPLVLSRDAVLADAEEARRLRELLIGQLAEGLSELARRRKTDFRKLLHQHGRAVKGACLEEKRLLDQIGDHIGFPSSLRDFVTLPDYLAARPDGDRTVIYAEDRSLGASLVPLYNRANIEVLYMTDPVDLRLQHAWTENGCGVTFQRLDVDPPTSGGEDRSDPASETERSTLEALRMLFRSAVDERLQVELRTLGADAPPAVLAVSEQDRKVLQAVEGMRRLKKEGRLDELPPEARGAATREGFVELLEKMTTQTVLLNTSNGVVENLAARLRGGQAAQAGQALLPEIARFLHAQALLASGLPLSNEKLSGISRQQTLLLTALLEHVPGRG